MPASFGTIAWTCADLPRWRAESSERSGKAHTQNRSRKNRSNSIGVSRLLDRRGERTRARKSYERALEAGLPATIDRAARHELARLAKRQREFGRATELWQELAASPIPSFEACEQLAIHYERRARNLREANGPRNWRSKNCGARSGSEWCRHGAMRNFRPGCTPPGTPDKAAEKPARPKARRSERRVLQAKVSLAAPENAKTPNTRSAHQV